MKDTATEPAEIVVVEDDAGVLSIIDDILCDEGYTTVTFRDGAQAEVYMALHVPRLLITDLRLPGLTGHDLVLRLRKYCGPHLPIVVMTGAAEIPRDKRLPVQQYLFKPFDLDELCAIVKRLAPPRLAGYAPSKLSPAEGAAAW